MPKSVYHQPGHRCDSGGIKHTFTLSHSHLHKLYSNSLWVKVCDGLKNLLKLGEVNVHGTLVPVLHCNYTVSNSTLQCNHM